MCCAIFATFIWSCFYFYSLSLSVVIGLLALSFYRVFDFMENHIFMFKYSHLSNYEFSIELHLAIYCMSSWWVFRFYFVTMYTFNVDSANQTILRSHSGSNIKTDKKNFFFRLMIFLFTPTVQKKSQTLHVKFLSKIFLIYTHGT